MIKATERRHPTSKPIPDSKDHRGWIDYWLKELEWAIGHHRMTGSLTSLDHATRSAHMLHGHAGRIRKSLRAEARYKLVVTAIRSQ